MEKQEKVKLLLKLQELQREHCDKIHFDISTQCESSLDNSEVGFNYIFVNINIFKGLNIINSNNFSFALNITNANKYVERTYRKLTSYIESLYKKYYNDSLTGE